MSNPDTELPYPCPPALTSRDVEYTVDEVAHMQAMAMQGATPPGELMNPAAAVVPNTQMRPVSGRYRGVAGDRELELRVDVDGRHPLSAVSGDFFQTTGGTTMYEGSFMVTKPTINSTQLEVVLDGQGSFTFNMGFPRLRVTIPRVGALLPPAAAVAQFMTAAGAPGPRITCELESPFFRRVELEQDVVTSVTLFQSYNTGLLPSGGSARLLTTPAAWAEAGIEMVDTGATDNVPIDEAGDNSAWSNAELHAAMEEHFSLLRDQQLLNEPAWRVWLLAATRHEHGFQGIMFDQQGAQRQGCAVFHDTLPGTSARTLRSQLHTYVHELGHCFNLLHSFDKEHGHPPEPNRLDALSYMQYPSNYVAKKAEGDAAFWAAFPFQFDDPELVHLRHGFRNDVIMGGNPFQSGAAIDPRLFADPIADRSGLAFTIRAAASYYCGEPVVIELKLETTDTRGKRVNSRIHPNEGYVCLAISRPQGHTVLYRPFLRQCVLPKMVTLDRNAPAVYDSAYVGYGMDGLYFEDPGIYKLRAAYYAPDGSRVLSNVLRLRVDAPADREEQQIADLFLGDEQGRLLYLLGSDSACLKSGNDAFDTMLARHGRHPMAVYAKLVKGANASRIFKTIETVDSSKRQISARGIDYTESARLLDDVINTTISANPGADPFADVGLDNITLRMVLERLLRVHHEAGNRAAAQLTAHTLVSHFCKPRIPAFVQDEIRRQTASFLGNGDKSDNPTYTKKVRQPSGRKASRKPPSPRR